MTPTLQISQTAVPPRVAGRCDPAGGRLRPPAFILHYFRPLGPPFGGVKTSYSFAPSIPATQPQHGVESQLWAKRILPRQLKVRTAAHRRSSGAFLLCQEFRHPLPLRRQLHFLQLAVVVFVDHLLDGAESKA